MIRMSRGRSSKDKRWFYGYELVEGGHTYIVWDTYENKVEVERETVGIYVGKIDREMNLIFEGDILLVEAGIDNNIYSFTAPVVFDWKHVGFSPLNHPDIVSVKVTGNIY